MNGIYQSDPTMNPQFCKFWRNRIPFFRNQTPADLDRAADRLLATGNVKKAELLSWHAADIREGGA